MRIRTIFLASTFSALGVALVMAGFAVVLLLENRELRFDLRTMRVELEQARDEARAEAAEREAVRADLAAQREQVESLSAKLASLQEKAKEPAALASVRLPLQSHRVRAYLGKDQVGMGWLVPNQVRTNAVDGQVSYEPVIVLDDAVRERVGVTQTNVVEREVARSTNVHYTYQQAYASSWPIFRVRPGGQRPGEAPPVSTQPDRPPQVQSPFLSTQIWHPQSPPGRPGGEWISSGTRSGRPLAAPANQGGSSPFPARY